MGQRCVKVLLPIIVILSMSQHLPQDYNLDVVEYFAGVQTIVTAARNQGKTAAAFDMEIDSRMNILDPLGFSYAVELMLRLTPKGLVHFAPPCGTWVFMSRGITGRSKTRPEGWTEYRSVSDANVITIRVTLLILIAMAKGCTWVVEQPAISVMGHFPQFKRIVDKCGFRIFTWMGAFGAHTPKATLLWSNNKELLFLMKMTINRSSYNTDVSAKVAKK